MNLSSKGVGLNRKCTESFEINEWEKYNENHVLG
jgi:hypothetical protein